MLNVSACWDSQNFSAYDRRQWVASVKSCSVHTQVTKNCFVVVWIRGTKTWIHHWDPLSISEFMQWKDVACPTFTTRSSAIAEGPRNAFIGWTAAHYVPAITRRQCQPFTQFTTSCYKCLVFYIEASISAKQTVHKRVPAMLLVPVSTAQHCKFDGLQILPGNAELWTSFFVRMQLAARVAQFVTGIRTFVDRNAHSVVVCTVYYV